MNFSNYLSESFTITEGLKQGNRLASTLFNITLEFVIRKMSICRNETPLIKFKQIVAYTDDINITSRTRSAIRGTYEQLTNNANKTKVQNQKLK